MKTRITWRGGKTGFWIIEDEATAYITPPSTAHWSPPSCSWLPALMLTPRTAVDRPHWTLPLDADREKWPSLLRPRWGPPRRDDKGWQTLLGEAVFSAKSERL